MNLHVYNCRYFSASILDLFFFLEEDIIYTDYSLCSAKCMISFFWREGQGAAAPCPPPRPPSQPAEGPGKAGPLAPTFPVFHPNQGIGGGGVGEGVRAHRPLAPSPTHLRLCLVRSKGHNRITFFHSSSGGERVSPEQAGPARGCAWVLRRSSTPRIAESLPDPFELIGVFVSFQSAMKSSYL